MDYTKFTDTILPQVLQTMRLINNPEIDPEVRQLNQEILLREVGAAVYAKIYDMNAYDMEIAHTTGPGIDNRHYGLAKVAAGSVSNGTVGLDGYVATYLNSVIGMAQQHAFTNAKQSGKRPTVTRILSGKENCPWCSNLAGTHTDPTPDVFGYHNGCDCSIVSSGFKSRNGQLNTNVKTAKH